jgi:hypothetical protein
MSTHRIDIEPLSLGNRGQRYLVRHAGSVLVESSRNPEFDACRLLLVKGITGMLEVWHTGATFAAMRLDIAKGATLTVEDSDRVGPRFARWRPRSENITNADPNSAHEPRIVNCEAQVGTQPGNSEALKRPPSDGAFDRRRRQLQLGEAL